MEREGIDLSVIIPVRNSSRILDKLHFYLTEVLVRLNKRYEIIFVDDGSIDNSFDILKTLNQKDKRVKIIKLLENFGQHPALSAGMSNIRGETLVIMDDDLQNDPSDIPKLLKKIDDGYDIVLGWRKNREDAIFKRKIPSYLTNLLISFLLGIRIHDIGCAMKAFTKEAVDEIKCYDSLPAFSGQLRNHKIIEVEVKGSSSQLSQSRYRFIDLIRLFFMVFLGCFEKKCKLSNIGPARKYIIEEIIG